MKIACLAWGSLLWKSDPLPLASPWQAGGPALPLEFSRVGDLAELSPALCVDTPPMPTWWALLSTVDIPTAREQLREREQIRPDRPQWVGSIPGNPNQLGFQEINAWRIDHGFDAVVWTALPPRYAGEEGRRPSADEALGYLRGLQGKARAHARDYIERMPPEFASHCRAKIETELGWKA